MWRFNSLTIAVKRLEQRDFSLMEMKSTNGILFGAPQRHFSSHRVAVTKRKSLNNLSLLIICDLGTTNVIEEHDCSV
ncbi:hypothetical protein DFP79_0529 [Marinomonas balearica]|uniref:Uncharacterized protein n=1 Tax=Marinomonas balearica TaxID=491947 RepID=A0A4R6MDE4_9GAMM|nr:hypothetical protein DFP79_0529 [Marinomonas balearica]